MSGIFALRDGHDRRVAREKRQCGLASIEARQLRCGIQLGATRCVRDEVAGAQGTVGHDRDFVGFAPRNNL